MLQRRVMAAGRRHGVTQEALAAHLGMSRGYVSQFTTSGAGWRPMSLSEFVGLLELAGDGEAASDVLSVLAHDHGVRTTPEEAPDPLDPLATCRELSEGLRAAADPGQAPSERSRELREAARAAVALADQIELGGAA